jgi:hypothetical protein
MIHLAARTAQLQQCDSAALVACHPAVLTAHMSSACMHRAVGLQRATHPSGPSTSNCLFIHLNSTDMLENDINACRH